MDTNFHNTLKAIQDVSNNSILKTIRDINNSIPRLDNKNYKNLLDYSHKIKQQFAPLNQSCNSLLNAVDIKPIIGQTIELSKIGKIIKEHNRRFSDIASFTKKIEIFNNEYYNRLERLQKLIKELPERHISVAQYLLQNGWYFDDNFYISSINKLENLINNENFVEVEYLLINNFEERLSDIEILAIEENPKRKNIIKDIFIAHREEKYNLSIPTLLSQVDGICRDMFGEYLFMTSKNKPKTSIVVEKTTFSKLEQHIFSYLLTRTTVNYNSWQRAEHKNTNELNRHAILHGESVDYGTKINSLKSIALLNSILSFKVDEVK